METKQLERPLNRKEREMRATVSRKILAGQLLTEADFVVACEAGIYDVKFSERPQAYQTLKASYYHSPTLEGYLCNKHRSSKLDDHSLCMFGIHADQTDPQYLTPENKDYLGHLLRPEAETYTQWGIKYPWHVSDKPYPADEDGDCTCQCIECKAHGAHRATREAHLHAYRK